MMTMTKQAIIALAQDYITILGILHQRDYQTTQQSDQLSSWKHFFVETSKPCIEHAQNETPSLTDCDVELLRSSGLRLLFLSFVDTCSS